MRLLTLVRTSLAGIIATSLFASPGALRAEAEWECGEAGSNCSTGMYCKGEFAEYDGCKIQCYNKGKIAGQIEKSSNATCEPI